MASINPEAMALPELSTLNFSLPAICVSIRLPLKPDGAFTPRPVPEVLHAFEVPMLAGSISSCGFVVVAVPPVYQLPLIFTCGVEAALPI